MWRAFSPVMLLNPLEAKPINKNRAQCQVRRYNGEYFKSCATLRRNLHIDLPKRFTARTIGHPKSIYKMEGYFPTHKNRFRSFYSVQNLKYSSGFPTLVRRAIENFYSWRFYAGISVLLRTRDTKPASTRPNILCE